MTFGLIQWLMSFAVFIIVLSIITWSALHLGQKNHEFVSLKFLDRNNYPIRRGDTSIIVQNATSAVTVSVNNTTPFADHQGLEVQDLAQFYKILQAISSTQERAISGTQNDAAGSITAATLASPIVGDNPARSEDVAAATYNMSDESAALNKCKHIGEEIIKSSTDAPQTARSIVPHGYRVVSDTERLRKSDSHSPDETELFDLSRGKGNGASNASVALSFVRISPGVERTDTVKRTKEITKSTRVAQNERIEIDTIPPHFYVTVYTTEEP